MHSDVWPPSSPGPFSLAYAGTAAGVWGPVVEASFIADVDYRYIGNSGTPYHDVQTSGGAPVRVRTEFAPNSITAVAAVDGGSVVVTSYDLSEADLLLIVDGLRVDDSGVATWDHETLPAGLEPAESASSTVVLTQYQLQRGPGESLSVLSVPVDNWQMPLGQRLMHPDAESIEVAGHPALVYGYDSRSRDSAGAVYTDGELFYILDAGPGGPSTSQRTMEDITALLQTLEAIPIADIASELGLRPRSEVIGGWIADTPLPDGIDLTWMLDGPPLNPDQEAFTAHQIFECTWAGEWIESGDTAALDEIQASQDWPTASVLALSRPGSSLSRSMDASIEEARSITSLQDRRTSALALNCSFLVGPAE